MNASRPFTSTSPTTGVRNSRSGSGSGILSLPGGSASRPEPVRERVQDEEAVDPLRMLRRPVQADRPAPVLRHDDRRRAGRATRAARRAAARGAALGTARGHAASSERPNPRWSGTIARCPASTSGRDEVAVQVAPGRVAVHHHHGAAVARALVHVVHAPVGRVEPLRLVGPGSLEGPVRHCGHRLSLGEEASWRSAGSDRLAPPLGEDALGVLAAGLGVAESKAGDVAQASRRGLRRPRRRREPRA